MARSVGPFTVIYGDEEFFLDKAIEAKRLQWKQQKRSITFLDGEFTNESSFLALCETQSIFEDDLRGIILDNAQELKVGKRLESFLGAKDPKDSSILIMIVYRGTNLPKSWAEAVRKGSDEHYGKFKPWELDKVYKRTVEEAKRLNLRLGKGVPEMLHYALGDNLRAVVNELRKLSYLVGSNGLVEKTIVASVVAPDVPAEPWQVAEAALSKNPVKAMNLVALLHAYMGDGFVVPVTIGLQRQVEKILMARQMLDKGDAISTIAASMDKSEFFCQKNVIPVARRHTVRELLGHMNTLCKLESRVKGAARSKRTLVELAVLSIAI
jgi:DNA polymerase III delta subunit